jgi:hypothetical protein
MSRRRSRKLRHTRRLRHNPKLVKGALTVVSVNTYRLAWAARAYEASRPSGCWTRRARSPASVCCPRARGGRWTARMG